jgi:hypothetical protein
LTTDEQHHLLSFLKNCSPTSLGNFLLAKQNRAANLERDLRDLAQELCENLVFIELACLLRNNGQNVRSLEKGQGVVDLSLSPTYVPPNGWYWIWQRNDLDFFEKGILQNIKMWCDRNHCGRPTRGQLMKTTGLSRATLTRVLATLRKKRFIESMYTGRGNKIRILEPPSPLFSGGSDRAPRRLTESTLGARLEPPQPSGGSDRAPLYVKNVLHGNSVGRSNGNLGEIGVRGVTPEPARPDISDRELKKLQLEAEILGRTERLQKKALTSEIQTGRGPQVGPARVRPEVLERIHKRELAKKAGR